MSDKPLVSIVTPAYKGAVNFLEEQIESVLMQTYPNIEHIVIDDGSPDEGKTLAILARYPHLRSWSRPNIGQYATQNEGFRAAKGVWLTANGQDDRYADKYAIESIVDHAMSHPKADAIHGNTRHVDDSGVPFPVQPKQNYPYWTLQYHLFFAHCSLFVKTEEIMKKELFFDPTFSYTGDAEWVFRTQLAGLKFSHVNRVISEYRHHSGQMTTNANVNSAAAAAREAERLRIRTKYGPNDFLRMVVQNWVAVDRRSRVIGAMLRGYRRENGVWVKR